MRLSSDVISHTFIRAKANLEIYTSSAKIAGRFVFHFENCVSRNLKSVPSSCNRTDSCDILYHNIFRVSTFNKNTLKSEVNTLRFHFHFHFRFQRRFFPHIEKPFNSTPPKNQSD